MSILAFPEPKLAMTAGASTAASRTPNWARTSAVATTRSEPRGSLDMVPSCNRFADGKPLLARSAHTRESHDTTAARLTWCSIQVMACFLAAASAASSWLIPARPPGGRSGDAPRREWVDASPTAPATSTIQIRSAEVLQRHPAHPIQHLHDTIGSKPPP